MTPMEKTSQEILTSLASIVEEFIGVPIEDVKPDANLIEDLDIDSLSMVEIVVSAQDTFGVQIPDEELKNLLTVGDVVSYVHRSLVAA
jgi:acyl carrier protein